MVAIHVEIVEIIEMFKRCSVAFHKQSFSQWILHFMTAEHGFRRTLKFVILCIAHVQVTLRFEDVDVVVRKLNLLAKTTLKS